MVGSEQSLAAHPARSAPAVVLLGLAVFVGGLTAAQALGIGPTGGSLGLAYPAFAATWMLMMTAMMLPSVLPIALRYARMIGRPRGVRLAMFTAGYLGVWSVSAVPAYWLMVLVGRTAAAGETAATTTVSAVLAACGAYQLTPIKDRCLRVCRAPLGLMLRYASWRGRLRDLRVGAHHGGFCLACCWALMVLMAVVGAMSLLVMVAVLGVVAIEKLAPGGPRFARAVGVAAVVLAVAVWWLPALVPGVPDPGMTM